MSFFTFFKISLYTKLITCPKYDFLIPIALQPDVAHTLGYFKPHEFCFLLGKSSDVHNQDKLIREI